MITKRTEITIEVEEVAYAASRPNGLTRGWCRVCGAEVTMAPPEDASATAKVSVRTINRCVEGDNVHYMETPDDALIVGGHPSD